MIKQVEMTFRYWIMTILVVFSLKAESQMGRLALSPDLKTEHNIGKNDITVTYSRPSIRDRIIFGDLVPYGKLWRTAANRNTTLEFSRDVMVGESRLKKGKYAIFSLPTPKTWDIYFYADTDNWDLPEVVDSAKIVARIHVPTKQIDATIENMSINFGSFTTYDFELEIKWELTMVT